MSTLESCLNPWKPSCHNTDIIVSILYHENVLPICSSCWSEIVEEREWGENPVTPLTKTVEERVVIIPGEKTLDS